METHEPGCSQELRTESSIVPQQTAALREWTSRQGTDMKKRLFHKEKREHFLQKHDPQISVLQVPSARLAK